MDCRDEFLRVGKGLRLSVGITDLPNCDLLAQLWGPLVKTGQICLIITLYRIAAQAVDVYRSVSSVKP